RLSPATTAGAGGETPRASGHLKRKYGLSLEEYDAMLADQGGGCAICQRSADPVDHDHGTGLIRGLLCFTCNNALGDFEDDPVLLRKALAYVEGPIVDEIDEAIRRRARALRTAA
ncbi:MAG: endonuclease VII domain-containing protein, partial [Acidimicrobiales bacterium]